MSILSLTGLVMLLAAIVVAGVFITAEIDATDLTPAKLRNLEDSMAHYALGSKPDGGDFCRKRSQCDCLGLQSAIPGSIAD